MGLTYSYRRYITEPELQMDPDIEATFDPHLGFDKPRKERSKFFQSNLYRERKYHNSIMILFDRFCLIKLCLANNTIYFVLNFNLNVKRLKEKKKYLIWNWNDDFLNDFWTCRNWCYKGTVDCCQNTTGHEGLLFGCTLESFDMQTW